jgi:hypothetical protein
MRIVLLISGLLVSASVLGADLSLPEFICADVSEVSERAQCVERARVVTRHDTAPSGSTVQWYSWFWPVGWWVIYYGFGLLIGRYIYRDAKRREWVFLGVRPILWAALALVDPAFGLLVYWATHYSKFAQSYHDATESPSSAASDT